MFLPLSNEGKFKYSLLYGRGSKVTILIGRHFQSGMLPFERASKKFFFEFGDLTKSALSWRTYPSPLRVSSITLLPREAQKLPQSRFSCMLIPFSMFLLDPNEGKVKYSPLYGRGSKVTILIGRHFQSGMLPFERASKKFLFEFGDQTKSALSWRTYPSPLRVSSMTLLPREAQKLALSRFSCMLIPFSMFLLDPNEGKFKYSPLYGRGSKVTILIGRHFQSGMLPFERASKKFFFEFGDLTKSALSWRTYPSPLRVSSITLLPREAQKLPQSRFSCMLIPFSMFLLDPNEGKVKYSPLYGRGSKVTILVGRHFQSGMLPSERASKKTWLGHIFV